MFCALALVGSHVAGGWGGDGGIVDIMTLLRVNMVVVLLCSAQYHITHDTSCGCVNQGNMQFKFSSHFHCHIFEGKSETNFHVETMLRYFFVVAMIPMFKLRTKLIMMRPIFTLKLCGDFRRSSWVDVRRTSCCIVQASLLSWRLLAWQNPDQDTERSLVC